MLAVPGEDLLNVVEEVDAAVRVVLLLRFVGTDSSHLAC